MQNTEGAGNSVPCRGLGRRPNIPPYTEKRVSMKTSDFDYDLPQELIAQTPVEPRDSSRLLVYHRDTGAVEHKIFRDVIDYLNPGDVLVINQTRVIPARLYGTKEGTGGAIEFLLVTSSNCTFDAQLLLDVLSLLERMETTSGRAGRV